MIRRTHTPRTRFLNAVSWWIGVLCSWASVPEDCNPVERHLNRALSTLTAGENEKAASYATEAIRLAPGRADAYRTRALISMGRSEFGEAITDLNEAIRLEPDYAEGYGLRASVHMSNGRLEHAILDWTNAIRLKPTYGDAYCGRAFTYVEACDYEEAIDDATEAIHLDPADADAYCARGLAFRAIREFDRAIRDFDRALALSPHDARALWARAAVANATGRLDEAIADATEAIRLEPHYADAYRCREVAYGAKGERGEARTGPARAEDPGTPTSSELHFCKGHAPTGLDSDGHWRERYRTIVYDIARRRRRALIQKHRSKRRFAKAYFALEREFDHALARVRQEIASGGYNHFIESGIPREAITPGLARQLFAIWRKAMRSQFQRLDLHFQLRWNDKIQRYRPLVGRGRVLDRLFSQVASLLAGRPRPYNRDDAS